MLVCPCFKFLRFTTLPLRCRMRAAISESGTPRRYLSHALRIWYFSSSVNSFFKVACAAIQWGWMSDFLSDTSTTSCMRIAKALARLRGCAGSPEPSLVTYVISTIISRAGLFSSFIFLLHSRDYVPGLFKQKVKDRLYMYIRNRAKLCT